MREENIHLHIKIWGLILFNWEFTGKNANEHDS